MKFYTHALLLVTLATVGNKMALADVDAHGCEEGEMWCPLTEQCEYIQYCGTMDANNKKILAGHYTGTESIPTPNSLGPGYSVAANAAEIDPSSSLIYENDDASAAEDDSTTEAPKIDMPTAPPAAIDCNVIDCSQYIYNYPSNPEFGGKTAAPTSSPEVVDDEDVSAKGGAITGEGSFDVDEHGCDPADGQAWCDLTEKCEYVQYCTTMVANNKKILAISHPDGTEAIPTPNSLGQGHSVANNANEIVGYDLSAASSLSVAAAASLAAAAVATVLML